MRYRPDIENLIKYAVLFVKVDHSGLILMGMTWSGKVHDMVGGKKGNRTEPTDYTGRSLRNFPIVAVSGFTSVTEPNQQMRYLLPILLLFLLVFYQTNYLRF